MSTTYKRTGQAATVTDVTGQRAFSYGSDLQVQQEQFTGGFYGTSRAMTYVYDTSGVIGRLDGVNLGTTGNPTADQVTSYGYQADGRVASIAGHGAGLTNYSFAYGYTANADLLIASVTNAASGFAQNRTYESFRNLVTNVTTAYGATTKAQFDYTYNNLGQRLTAAQSGEVFGDYGASPQVQYGYDGRGQLTAAAYSLGGVAMPGRQYGYAYDSGGNRTSANHTGNATFAEDYTANNLNQITEHENTVIPVQGTAAAGANVVVQNTTRAGRAGNYWGTEALLNNATGPVQGSIPILAGLPGSPDQVTTPVTKTVFQAAFNESLGYDNDGNLSADGRWSYTWDAENRLTSMETTVAAIAAGLPDMLVQFRYDYLGRRVKKTVTVNGTQQSERRYVYNGWNLAAELDASGSIQRHFIWGLDLSGTIAGAGGVGGLLMIQDGGSSYLPAYDGGGNVVALLSAADGYDAAIYEYSPFGEQLRGEGLYAASNPFRFSTKFFDGETGLSYYGYRYYSAKLGRFINRDPIEEKGGLNLYGFCSNSPVNAWDLLGLDDEWPQSKNNPGGNTPPPPKQDPPKDDPPVGDPFWWRSSGPNNPWSSTVWVNPDHYIFDNINEKPLFGSGNSGPRYSVTVGPFQSLDTGETVGTSATTWCSDGTITTVSWASNNQGSISQGNLAAASGAFASYTMGKTAPPGCSVVRVFTTKTDGTDAVLYRNDTTGALILAYRGSQTFGDWLTDIYNAIGGKSSRYEAAVTIAFKVQDLYRDANITLAGHSLGGGEAALAAVVTGLNAVTLNAAGVNPANYGYANSASGQITNYSVFGEPLTIFQALTPFPNALGTQVILTPRTFPTLSNAFDHSASSVLSAMGAPQPVPVF